MLEATGLVVERPVYGIGGQQQAGVGSGIVPGPHQFHFALPRGARSLTVNAKTSAAASTFTAAPLFRVLLREEAPITFTRTGNALTHDAHEVRPLSESAGTLSANVPLEVPCQGELFVTFGNQAPGEGMLQELTLELTERTDCATVEDAGVTPPPTDAGVDAGAPASADAGAGGERVEPRGCGCGAGPSGLNLALLLLLVGGTRRRARR